MVALIVAETVPRATRLAVELGISAVAVSPRSIKAGAGRGLTDVTKIVVDASVWPLAYDIREQLAPHQAAIVRHCVMERGKQ